MTGGIPHSHSGKCLNNPHVEIGLVMSFLGAMAKKKNLSWITYYHESKKKMAMDTELPHLMEQNLKHRLPMTN
jgi:hypothetical protein